MHSSQNNCFQNCQLLKREGRKLDLLPARTWDTYSLQPGPLLLLCLQGGIPPLDLNKPVAQASVDKVTSHSKQL